MDAGQLVTDDEAARLLKRLAKAAARKKQSGVQEACVAVMIARMLAHIALFFQQEDVTQVE
jgi:hypothetical protein